MKPILSMLVMLAFGIFGGTSAQATISNDNYILQINDFKTLYTQQEDTITNAKSKTGNTSISGFKISKSYGPFLFSVSDSLVAFGPLSPTNPVTRAISLMVSNGQANGYSLFISENKQLSLENGDTIPDTSCDNGSCTHTSAGPWDNTLTYGFGYRCDPMEGNDCADGFSDENYFKHFPNAAAGEKTQVIMRGNNNGYVSKTTITYKLNIAGTQPSGKYTNTVTYVAVPYY